MFFETSAEKQAAFPILKYVEPTALLEVSHFIIDFSLELQLIITLIAIFESQRVLKPINFSQNHRHDFLVFLAASNL